MQKKLILGTMMKAHSLLRVAIEPATIRFPLTAAFLLRTLHIRPFQTGLK